MTPKSIAIAITAASLCGQVQHLATDFTGSVLYFASTHRECVRDDEPQSKIFRWSAADGIRTHVSIAREWQPPNARGDRWTNFYSLDSPSLTADGTTLAYVGHQDCQCRLANLRFAEMNIRRGDSIVFREQRNESQTDAVQTEISRNGRFLAFRFGSAFEGRIGARELSAFGPQTFSYGVAPWTFGDRAIAPRQTVADNGWGANVDEFRRLVLVTEPDPPPNRPRPPRPLLPASALAASWRINAAGTVVVYESLVHDGLPRRLFALDVSRNRETFLFTDGVPDSTGLSLPGPIAFFSAPYPRLEVPRYLASMDESGEWVLALAREKPAAPRQWLVLLRSDGSETRWLGYAPEGYREALLSGNGEWIFAVTQWGRLLRIHARTAEFAELLPRTPWISELAGSQWRGSNNRIVGGGFATETWEVTEYPAPTEAAGVRVEFNGQPLPLLKVSPSEIVYQIPWESPGFNPEFNLSPEMTVRIIVPHDSKLMIPTITLPIGYARVAVFEEPGPLHENGEPINLLKPARPGEVIRALTSGYDRPRGRTGFPATPEEAAQPGLECSLEFDPSGILRTGLAVGKVGVYEVAARLPEKLSETVVSQGWTTLQCFDGVRAAGLSIPVKP